MNSKDLIKVYKNQELAAEAFRVYRLQKGVFCKRCAGKDHYWLKAKQQFQCKNCKFRTTLKSGTIMEGCKLPLSYFFITLYLLIKKGNKLTVDELQEITGHKYFEPLWSFLPRVKQYMDQEDLNDILLSLINAGNHKLYLESDFSDSINLEV